MSDSDSDDDTDDNGKKKADAGKGETQWSNDSTLGECDRLMGRDPDFVEKNAEINFLQSHRRLLIVSRGFHL